MATKISLSNIPGFCDLAFNNDTHAPTTNTYLNKVVCKTTDNQEYKVIRYDKKLLSNYLVPSFGLCRSIIVNSENQVVCFSPPKSVSSEEFIKKYPKTDTILAMEFIEGTMINVFWEPGIGVYGGWQISTRNTVGATSSFYKSSNSITFREMFLEALQHNNLIIEGLNKQHCYSFVLQHPKNRIVVAFDKPQLYLVGCYTINSENVNGNVNITVTPHSISDVKKDEAWRASTIKFPKIYEWSSYSELIEKYASMNTDYSILGVVLYNVVTGERSKIRNPVYEEVRMLRGNQPKLQYQYICLRNQGKVGDFLKFYPENKQEFSQFRDQIHAFTTTLYENYVSCYIKKNNPLSEFTSQYKTHMFNLHKLYLEDLKPGKQFITRNVVIHYVNKLHPSLLMHSLNYHMRKRVVDFTSADTNL